MNRRGVLKGLIAFLGTSLAWPLSGLAKTTDELDLSRLPKAYEKHRPKWAVKSFDSKKNYCKGAAADNEEEFKRYIEALKMAACRSFPPETPLIIYREHEWGPKNKMRAIARYIPDYRELKKLADGKRRDGLLVWLGKT